MFIIYVKHILYESLRKYFSVSDNDLLSQNNKEYCFGLTSVFLHMAGSGNSKSNIRSSKIRNEIL